MWGNLTMGQRGQMDLKQMNNPYNLFPQCYNFRYNIYSESWPVANRLLERYLQKNSSRMIFWGMQGVSPDEQANMLMAKHSFSELLVDIKHRDLLNNVIALKVTELFAPAEINTGVNAFRDSVFNVLKHNEFKNIRFETLLDTLGRIGKADLKAVLPTWEHPTPMPYYRVGEPSVTNFDIRGQQTYVSTVTISNLSDYDGIIGLQMVPQVPPGYFTVGIGATERRISVKAHQSVEVISHWDLVPSALSINTLISENLPQTISQNTGKMKEQRSGQLPKEGAFAVNLPALRRSNELIVDDVDSLFSCSSTNSTGLLAKWLQNVGQPEFKYTTVWWWNAPRQWTATIHNGYFGDYIRSAHVIRAGKGNQTATWRLPIPQEGRYELFFHYVNTNQFFGNNQENNHHYKFKIRYDRIHEDEVELQLRNSDDPWLAIGTYFFTHDTVYVTLNNSSEENMVAADAVKLLWR